MNAKHFFFSEMKQKMQWEHLAQNVLQLLEFLFYKQRIDINTKVHSTNVMQIYVFNSADRCQKWICNSVHQFHVVSTLNSSFFFSSFPFCALDFRVPHLHRQQRTIGVYQNRMIGRRDESWHISTAPRYKYEPF